MDAIIAACRAALDAKRNDPERMFQLGRALTAGGRHREAIQLFFDAADRLHVGAMTELGVMFEFGRGVPTNLATANTWYKRAADDGSPQAMNELGRWNENGTNGDIDLDAAKVWYEKAAALGSAAALNRLGEFYEEGRGVPQSSGGRSRFVCQSRRPRLAASDDPSRATERNRIGVPAKLALGPPWYEGPSGLATQTPWHILAGSWKTAAGLPNLTAAKEWYDKGAAMGSALAMANLAALFEHGRGVSQNLVQARLWYERAAALELPRALNALGQLYLTGGGGPKNSALPKSSSRRLQPVGRGCHANIGLLYRSGRGVERDEAEASSWFIKAAALGDQTAQSNLSRMKEALRAGYSSLAAQVVARRAECFQACRSLHRTYVDTVCQQHFSDRVRLKKVLAGIALILACGFRTSARERAEIGHSNSQSENSCQACFQALIQCSQKRGESTQPARSSRGV